MQKGTQNKNVFVVVHYLFGAFGIDRMITGNVKSGALKLLFLILGISLIIAGGLNFISNNSVDESDKAESDKAEDEGFDFSGVAPFFWAGFVMILVWGIWAFIDSIVVLINALTKSKNYPALYGQGSFRPDTVNSAFILAIVFFVLGAISSSLAGQGATSTQENVVAESQQKRELSMKNAVTLGYGHIFNAAG